MDLQDFGNGFMRICKTLEMDLQGFTKLWKWIYEDLQDFQDFGNGLMRIYETS